MNSMDEDPQVNSNLSTRIDAQLEVYRKISTDYANIISALNQLKSEVKSLCQIQKEDGKEIIVDLNKIFDFIELHIKSINTTVETIKNTTEKEQIDISALTTYQENLNNSIKTLLDELSKTPKIDLQTIVDLKNILSEISNTVKILHSELIKKKRTLNTRIYYIAGAVATIIAILETLSQFNILQMTWLPK
jgi:chromosome segregation ATPase